MLSGGHLIIGEEAVKILQDSGAQQIRFSELTWLYIKHFASIFNCNEFIHFAEL